jgi:hypothetical protein
MCSFSLGLLDVLYALQNFCTDVYTCFVSVRMLMCVLCVFNLGLFEVINALRNFCTDAFGDSLEAVLPIPKYLRVSFRLFNGFPVVNWYYKPLEAVLQPSIIMRMAVKAETRKSRYYDTEARNWGVYTCFVRVRMFMCVLCVFSLGLVDVLYAL